MTAHILFISIEIQIPQAQSLKTKRKTVKSLKDRIRDKYNASVAEIDYQDKWQRALIGVAMLGNNKQVLEKDAYSIERLVAAYPELNCTFFNLEWI